MKQWVNHGFTLNGGHGSSDKNDANAILIDPLFKKAKDMDIESANALWQREWDKSSAENKKLLEEAISGSEEIVFISMPGTSRKNRIPIAAARLLAKEVGEKARFINGEKSFIPVHTSMMKSISHRERVFHPRVFETHHMMFDVLKRACPKARFFIVEDLLTTGNSAHSFQRFLEKNGIPVYGVIAMKGEYEPNVPPNLVKKIDKFFKQNDIPIDAEKLSQELTNKEAQNIAFQIANLFKNSDDQHKQLFRELFKTLYDIRVNGNHQVLPHMDTLGKSLTEYLMQKEKETKHEQSQKTNHSGQASPEKSNISQILEDHSGGRISQLKSQGSEKDGISRSEGSSSELSNRESGTSSAQQQTEYSRIALQKKAGPNQL